MISFTIHGTPKPTPRVRAFVRGKHAGVYTPPVADDWKACIVLAARDHRPAEPITGPVRVAIAFRFVRPAAHCGTGKNAGVVKRQFDFPWHVGRGDIDNLCKGVLDVLTDIGFWKDDGIVAELDADKRYALQPGATVTIDELAP